jgi:hypothetical protein
LFRLANGHWRKFTTPDGLSHDEVRSLAADKGDVWVGYQFGREIDRIRTAGSRVSVDREVGPRDDSKGTTYFLGFDAQHNLWAGTNRGVYVRDGDKWRHYSQHDGLVWDDCDLNGFAAGADGAVWIGTSGGLSHFTPRDQTPWKDPRARLLIHYGRKSGLEHRRQSPTFRATWPGPQARPTSKTQT